MDSVAKCVVVALACLLAVLPAFARFEVVEEEGVHRMVQKGNKGLNLLDFSWNDCGDATMPGHISRLSLSPDPLKLPGNVTVGVDASLTTTLQSPLSLDLYIQKKVLFWITLPCVDNMGSCNYEDICPLLAKVQCPQILLDHGINCKCPFAPGKYSLPSATFWVDDSSIPSFLAEGEYKVTARLQQNGKNVACGFVWFSLTQ